ncbi:MAG TPA: hypothetical protein VNG31_02560 [Candidatus Baltobacteraceae bacterium]|nr:hypothetical protein [Candidatus Baltobacteraceae bacterium]
MRALSTIGALAAVVAIAACSAHKTTVQTSSGAATVTTSQDNKSVTVQTSEGTMAIGKSVDLGKLGAPAYPGAQANDQGTITTTTDKGSSTIAAFKTGDSFDKVEAFYKQQLPAGSEKVKMSSGGGSAASFQVGGEDSADQVSVQVTASKPNETDILITHLTKSAASAASASPSPSTPASGG